VIQIYTAVVLTDFCGAAEKNFWNYEARKELFQKQGSHCLFKIIITLKTIFFIMLFVGYFIFLIKNVFT